MPLREMVEYEVVAEVVAVVPANVPITSVPVASFATDSAKRCELRPWALADAAGACLLSVFVVDVADACFL